MILHHSHNPEYRSPIGPVKAGASLILRILCDEASAVTLRLWQGGEQRVPMMPLEGHWFETTLEAPATPMLLWYDFIIHHPQGELRYGAPADGLGGEGEMQYGRLQSFQCTVYDPAFATPGYMHRGIIYQIFPDRFYKDAEGLGGRMEQIAQAHPEATFHAAWDEAPALTPDPENGDNQALDFFGGTLEGIRQKLDYLQAMGVSVLYLNPVFKARSNHRYDTGDYEAIDPILGDEGDFCALMDAAKSRGMRVLLDGVFSHTGADSKYFNRFGHYDSLGAYQSESSPYYPWYHFQDFPNEYTAWWGIYTLPAVQKENPTYLQYLLEEGKGVLPRWIRRGACGWRLDVADELPVPMLQRMRQAVKEADPEAILLAEVWEDASNKVTYGEMRSYCLGDTVDSAMNYPLRHAIIAFFIGETDAWALCRLLLHQREVYPAPFLYALMNLLGSHDRVRILNAMAGYDREGPEQMPPEEAAAIRLTQEQRTLGKKRHLEALRLLCALPGSPTVYYGDEVAMEGMADPWNRAPMEWDNGDATHWSEVSRLLNQRRKNPMLQTGFFDVEALDADTLRIRRYGVEGKDVFGQPLEGPEEWVEICRN